MLNFCWDCTYKIGSLVFRNSFVFRFFAHDRMVQLEIFFRNYMCMNAQLANIVMTIIRMKILVSLYGHFLPSHINNTIYFTHAFVSLWDSKSQWILSLSNYTLIVAHAKGQSLKLILSQWLNTVSAQVTHSSYINSCNKYVGVFYWEKQNSTSAVRRCFETFASVSVLPEYNTSHDFD